MSKTKAELEDQVAELEEKLEKLDKKIDELEAENSDLADIIAEHGENDSGHDIPEHGHSEKLSKAERQKALTKLYKTDD